MTAGRSSGMDLHRRRSRAGADDRGRPAARHGEDHQQPGGAAAEIARAGKSPRVVLEATYGWYWAADTLAAAGAEVHLAHPLGVKAFTYRRVKNDERDAADLADLLRMGRLPEAWIAPPEVRELRELTRYRHKLVHLRTSCKDQVHAVLAKLGVPVTCSDIFGKAGSAWLDQLGLPQPYAGKVTSLRQLTGELTTEITMLSEVIADLLAGDRGYQVIQQLPGIGPVLAAVIIAEIGDVTRFKNAAQLCSWAGLTPRHRESDIKVARGHVTKQGSRLLRWAVIEAIQRIPRGLGHRRGQRRDHRPPREGSPEHRQGRRRPAAAHPGVLRPARRADPLPARISRRPAGPRRLRGRHEQPSWPAARREVASCVCPAALTGGAGAPLIDPA